MLKNTDFERSVSKKAEKVDLEMERAENAFFAAREKLRKI
jgi:hypothetical protein